MQVRVQWMSGDCSLVEATTPTIFEVKQALLSASNELTCADLILFGPSDVPLGDECSPPTDVRVVVNRKDASDVWADEMRQHILARETICVQNVRIRMEKCGLQPECADVLCGLIGECATSDDRKSCSRTASVQIVRTCLAAKCAIDAKNSSGFTALMTACRWDCANIVALLLKERANVLEKNDAGWGALYYALQDAAPEVVWSLIEAKAECHLEEKNAAGLSPLTAAAHDGDNTMAMRLLALNADVNACDSDGNSPLIHAARTGSLELFDHAPVVNIRNKEGCTALHAAATASQGGFIGRLLAAMANVNECNEDMDTPLMLAAARKQGADCVSLLIEGLADVSSRDAYGQTPLHIAADAGLDDVIGILLAGNATVNSQDEPEYTPLMRACQGGFEDSISLLLDNSADVNHQNAIGLTALHETAREGSADVATLLLQRCADMDVQNNIGISPLMMACSKGNGGVAVSLLEHRADPEIVDNEGRSARTYAEATGLQDIVSLLPNKRLRIDSE